MSENNIPKQTRGVTLREPKDIRGVVQRITSKAFQEGSELSTWPDSPAHGLLDEGVGAEQDNGIALRIGERISNIFGQRVERVIGSDTFHARLLLAANG